MISCNSSSSGTAAASIDDSESCDALVGTTDSSRRGGVATGSVTGSVTGSASSVGDGSSSSSTAASSSSERGVAAHEMMMIRNVTRRKIFARYGARSLENAGKSVCVSVSQYDWLVCCCLCRVDDDDS
jgi:hypothetical protein